MKHKFYYYALLLGLAIALFSTGLSFYFEQVLDLFPCPMCIGQRVAMIGAGVFLCLAYIIIILYRFKQKTLLITKPKTYYSSLISWLVGVCFVLALLCLAAGGYIAARQVYLQTLPPGSAPACGPGLNFLVNYLPWQKVMEAIFHGSGECAKVSWRFLGLSIASWSAIVFTSTWFIVFIGYLSFIFSKNLKTNNQ